jgi:hypothetical protein
VERLSLNIRFCVCSGGELRAVLFEVVHAKEFPSILDWAKETNLGQAEGRYRGELQLANARHNPLSGFVVSTLSQQGAISFIDAVVPVLALPLYGELTTSPRPPTLLPDIARCDLHGFLLSGEM